MDRRFLEADFCGGELSRDGGLMLLRQVDAHLGLSRAAALAMYDPREPNASVTTCVIFWLSGYSVCAAAMKTRAIIRCCAAMC